MLSDRYVGLIIAVCVLMPVLTIPSPAFSDVDASSSYHDATPGLSFRYPPDVRPVVASTEELRGIGSWVHRVDLVPAGRRTDILPVLTRACRSILRGWLGSGEA